MLASTHRKGINRGAALGGVRVGDGDVHPSCWYATSP